MNLNRNWNYATDCSTAAAAALNLQISSRHAGRLIAACELAQTIKQGQNVCLPSAR